MIRNFIFSITVVILFAAGCSTAKRASNTDGIPGVNREFRAAWIATVANINWPSKPGLSTADQQKEALQLLDFLQKNHFNAAILQVRPQCDALYRSDLEPWSYFLTGQQGRAPEPYYDPLDFWVQEAHKRGLELHVWLNPYRAHHKDGHEISDQSIVKKRPDLVVYLKEGYWWLDPALPGTREHSTAVVMDIVKRYDIDGVHFDDYFYPYPSYNLGQDFPDSASWAAYRNSGGTLSRGDWRREAVNIFIRDLYTKIKKEEPYVKFGLSPFGIWRPGYPESIGGFDQYDLLYADARLWLNKGWIDYFTPQLYWPINRISQSFPVLLGWWSGENKKNRHLWPGISVGGDTSMTHINEVLSQVMIDRGMEPNSKGVVHWSISSLTRNPKLTSAIATGPYSQEALVPASPWLDRKPPAPSTCQVAVMDSVATIRWTHRDINDVFHWVLYYRHGNSWSYSILSKDRQTFEVPAFKTNGAAILKLNRVCVTAVDRTGNESVKKELGIVF
jgi:uncharacterized lipoprotein YddW (UPF0748 family)